MRDRPVLVHGFSVGGYLYSQVLHQMETNVDYSSVKDRILGQVFDSPVSFSGIPHGVSNAAMKNPALRSLMKSTIQAYLKTTAKYTTDIYLARQQLFYNNPVRSPTLLLYSKTDEVADAKICEHASNMWENLGMDVTSVCWDNSPHVSHFYVHQKEYVQAVESFADRVLKPVTV
ncbi:predicted protein [Nematostella vectensis]|uniref:Uncharacterized protein n=2 Tax=Nematostella vectensis TaxID=45351 RepID=A7RGU8_NEMVE|nr:predicted protein [Nematostella vectensis]|eukprot:XP_001641296.1 predicted protein [Nematostella vectensis]